MKDSIEDYINDWSKFRDTLPSKIRGMKNGDI
jgi:hypothetical protein